MEVDFWSFDLVKGGTFAAQLLFEDAAGEPVDLGSLTGIRMLVKYGTGQEIVWSTAGGQFQIIAPASGGFIRFSLTRSAIEALNFRLANYYLFLDSSTEGELVLEGTIAVK